MRNCGKKISKGELLVLFLSFYFICFGWNGFFILILFSMNQSRTSIIFLCYRQSLKNSGRIFETLYVFYKILTGVVAFDSYCFWKIPVFLTLSMNFL